MKARRIFPLLLLVMASCARTSGTVEVPPEDLPFAVTRQSSPAQTPAPARTFAVFFVRGGRLIETRRAVQAEEPAPEAALRALLDGPAGRERSLGITTELPGEVSFLQVGISGETARVDLSAEFQEPAEPDRIVLRVAQVVWTLTALREVRSVSFSIDGEPAAVATEDGAALDRPVTRLDYASLAPAP